MIKEPNTVRLVLEGHIIDSLLLPQLLDTVMDLGGNFNILSLDVGKQKADPSRCELEVWADNATILKTIIERAQDLGARLISERPARLAEIPADGVYPDDFYSTSNLQTFVLVNGKWIEVQDQEMDCAIAVDEENMTARCISFAEAKKGMKVVVGYDGVRVVPMERSRNADIFTFMSSDVSSEKPKKLVISEIATEMIRARSEGKKILVVAGPAIVHTGAARHLSQLIDAGYVQVLFAGNALAAHDVEAALFRTSLGVSLESGLPIAHGHANHMRAINRIRAAGSLKAAVDQGILTQGIMYTAIKKGIEMVLAGSIRDDGPIPDVITDVIEAQIAMRKALKGVGVALMLSTMLHSIATGNLLPASVKTVCVDINPATVTKLADRGTFHSIGLVTDVELFLRELLQALNVPIA